MAIVKCMECGGEVSDAAKACPKCGAPPPKRTSAVTWAVAGLVGIGVVSCIVGTDRATTSRDEAAATAARALASMPPEQREAMARAEEDRKRSERKREAGIALAKAAAASLKASMREPESFKVSDAILLPTGTVCLTYRARNGFGGMNVGRAAAPADHSGIVTTAARYNGLCGGLTGDDILGAL